MAKTISPKTTNHYLRYEDLPKGELIEILDEETSKRVEKAIAKADSSKPKSMTAQELIDYLKNGGV